MQITKKEHTNYSNESQEIIFRKVEVNPSKSYILTKRIIDIIVSIIGIVLLSPLLIIVSIIILLEDYKAPIIFKQTRVGLNNKKFNMYKFRSMVSNAEELKLLLMDKNEAEGPVFKMKNDPRITNIGRMLRKTSIDELPQLFNVLKGEMSLVGPRPPLPNEVEQYSNYEKQRLMVVPGLTCYWQVSGRSNIGFNEWMELDLKYISERNTLVDIKLILKTALVLFGSKDAY